MIDQQEWREGLPEPFYDRIFTDVHNVIVHHSAGSNTDTNYTGIVRNIYIYHTEIRGWSDIGYNYLVAPDGYIFKGRDPGSLEQDDVLGAHFCANNTGTMGICVMGTYTETAPSAGALASLKQLLNWKLGKDSLDPAGCYPHVLNVALPVIAGHRDGCATECPGESLYTMLHGIRYEVQDIYRACGYAAKPVSGIEQGQYSPVSLSFEAGVISIRLKEGPIQGFKLFDMLGREVCGLSRQVTSGEVVLFMHDLAGGIYLFSIMSNGNTYTGKLTSR